MFAPRPRSSTGADDPHAPFLIGETISTSAAIGASNFRHSRKPAVCSACVQASSAMSSDALASAPIPDAVLSELLVAPEIEPMGAVGSLDAGRLGLLWPGRNGSTTTPARSAKDSQIEIPESPLSGDAIPIYRPREATSAVRVCQLVLPKHPTYTKRARRK